MGLDRGRWGRVNVLVEQNPKRARVRVPPPRANLLENVQGVSRDCKNNPRHCSRRESVLVVKTKQTGVKPGKPAHVDREQTDSAPDQRDSTTQTCATPLEPDSPQPQTTG